MVSTHFISKKSFCFSFHLSFILNEYFRRMELLVGNDGFSRNNL